MEMKNLTLKHAFTIHVQEKFRFTMSKDVKFCCYHAEADISQLATYNTSLMK